VNLNYRPADCSVYVYASRVVVDILANNFRMVVARWPIPIHTHSQMRGRKFASGARTMYALCTSSLRAAIGLDASERTVTVSNASQRTCPTHPVGRRRPLRAIDPTVSMPQCTPGIAHLLLYQCRRAQIRGNAASIARHS
jgi:hypothetical protein